MTQQELEKLWQEHTTAEFVKRDLEATMATMTDDAYINIVPLNINARGKDMVLAFYRDILIPSVPDDLQATIVNRVIGERYLVDEVSFTLTHSKRMDWLLPNAPPTFKKIELDHVVVVEFRGNKIVGERVYWDQATVLKQAGLLKD
ncbi:MAG: hypothetical protein XU11_C0031G0010 [Candidatus Dadabacteria bacterium CSP1-2]|jgi:carboxymethylenebutenolidase|nr:MAG: hypothetical protein XU11_C0031G0010 [Candidatus Dadabacteria bacterium CSP1-2]MBF8303232.1 hypothetical protein [Candidatus Dadabacteria bacterium]OGE22966.1 MAG: hypothetical protein A2V51_00060 [Candidatus Dadabacteria bacterium RBG_19FT_COMBO_40_33]